MAASFLGAIHSQSTLLYHWPQFAVTTRRTGDEVAHRQGEHGQRHVVGRPVKSERIFVMKSYRTPCRFS